MKIEFDRLKMYFGEPFEIDLESALGKITVYQPTIGDVVEVGEGKFLSTLNVFVANTTMYRLMLWDSGLDWNEISDFQLFVLLKNMIDSNASKLLFGDLDWNEFQPMFRNIDDNNQALVLVNEKQNIEINEEVYEYFHRYIQTMFNMKPEDEFTEDKILKKWWIDKDRRKTDREAKKDDKKSVSLVSQISAYINHPGTKYKLSELKEVGVCEFYDSIQRLQIYESTTALMKGMYSGMIDSKNIKPEDYNFMKDIN